MHFSTCSILTKLLIPQRRLPNLTWFDHFSSSVIFDLRVTFSIVLVMFSDFAKIVREAKKRPLEGVTVLIERAPECKSIFVSGFSENTTENEVGTYFDEWGELVDVVFSPWNEKGKEKRAIVYFKEKKSKPLVYFLLYSYAFLLLPVDSVMSTLCLLESNIVKRELKQLLSSF